VAGAGAELIEPFADLLADELNVKSVEFTSEVERYGTFRLQPNGRLLGPKLGAEVQQVIKAAKAGDWVANADGTVEVHGHTLSGDEFDLALDPADGVAATPLPGNDAVIVLDTELTPELEAEGRARDLVRLIQQERKDRDLQVTDRIALTLALPGSVAAELEPHLGWIGSQVLATDIQQLDGPLAVEAKLGPDPITFDLTVQA
jgi:isoleucyl-tRNA synthetase